MNKTLKIFLGILILIIGCISLTSCGSPLDTTIDEINQRYKDHNPMFESDVKVRFKEPINVRKASDTVHISIWVPNYHDLEELKELVNSGEQIEGVFVTFEKTTRKFQRLNEDTLEMEWYEKQVVDAIFAEKKILTIDDLK